MDDPQPILKENPRTAWELFTPTRRSRWDERKAAHLLRRAAFGASWTEIEKAVKDGLPVVLDRLFFGSPAAAAFSAEADRLAEGAITSGDPRQLEAVWMHRMMSSPFPLQERLTLFWHDHFATSLAKVEDLRLMQRQNATLRRYALGNFPEMLHAMTRDPAMLIWLDSNTNRKGAANENYAREVFELFSLGLGQYTENDIKEAARALTGWSVQNGDPHFEPSHFDDSEKTVFGQRGKFTSGDVVRLCLGHPGCAKFVVRKLFQELISDAVRPSDELVEPLANGFRDRDYDIAWLVRRMLGSYLFYSDVAVQQRVKAPVEFIVGTVKTLEGRVSPVGASAGCAELGQRLFYPPSVKGWDGGRLWLNSSTLMRRQNMAFEVTRGEGDTSRCDPAKLAARYGASDSAALADFFLKLFFQKVDPAEREEMIRRLDEESSKLGKNPLMQRANAARLARAAAHLALTMPEYQLG
jgi:hypothetical protein